MEIAIIVEGKNDKAKLQRLMTDDVKILCTFGIPGTNRLDKLQQEAGSLPLFIFTDNDHSGKRIRFLLNELFHDAEQIYTSRGYSGVEGTPDEYLIQQLEKAHLEDFIKPFHFNTGLI